MPIDKIVYSKATAEGKKYKAELFNGEKREKTVQFGQEGASDFTRTGNERQKKNYLARHRPTEDWTKGGMDTAGFHSRWILWNKPTLSASARDVERRFGVEVEGF